MTRTICRFPALVAVAMALMVLLPGTAAANHSQETIFDATGDILRANSTAARNGILDQIESFGVDTVRVVVPWRDIVPSPQAAVRPAGFDPTNPDDYVGDIGAIDDVVRGATARGMKVLLTPSSPIPNWASRSGASYISDPKPDEFEALLQGLGSRYSGTHVPCVPIEPPPATPPTCTPTPPALPRVHMWSLYNEPNLNLYLQPQYRNGKSVAGTIYRSLFLAGQQGLAASGHGGDTVLIGETSPGPGTHSTAPIAFLRQVLCLDSRYHRRPGCAPISASGWAHHPYDLRGSPIKVSSRKLVTIATMSRLTDALARAAKAHATSRRLPVYVTEYGVETIPDPMGGVSFVKQAAYLALAEMLLWNNPQVRSYAQYLLTDDPGNGQFSFQSGLRRANGFRKASYDSFPISLVVRRLGRKLEFWGHVRPASGPVRVRVRQRDSAGPPFLLRTLRTDGGGYFKFAEPLHDGRRWSAQATLPDGTLLEGPYIPAFGF